MGKLRLREAKLLAQGHTARVRRSLGIAPTSDEDTAVWRGPESFLGLLFVLDNYETQVVFPEFTL